MKTIINNFNQTEEVKSFENLKIWQLARNFRKEIYKVSKDFPKREDYCLSSQVRSSAISITANIAEGYGRYHFQEAIQFCRVARGSLNETLDHLYTAFDEDYIIKEIFDDLYNKGREVERVLNGYITYLQKLNKK